MSEDCPRLVAFYLPQYHPVPENDAWWGKGFTEWTNVTRAGPLFDGHEQPRLPADLGFYDLRVPETRDAQAELARRYGITAFCYYFYWFAGRRFLHRPLDEMLASRRPDMPFCLCWANETLTRRWDGRDRDVLLEQVHSPESDRRFIEAVLPFLADPRYLRVDGVPVLLIYRPPLLADPQDTVEYWRARCRSAGLGGLHVAGMETFGFADPRPAGFDSAVEFFPHGARGDDIGGRIGDRPAGFSGRILDYASVAAR
ncbi:MAG TPA: glycoside hydrolase family 99-like domain-containing protein, partial [Thalassobaculum sp.]